MGSTARRGQVEAEIDFASYATNKIILLIKLAFSIAISPINIRHMKLPVGGECYI